VCDLYVTSTKKVKLIDFNNWGGGTLPLLFEWKELEEIGRSTADTSDNSGLDPGGYIDDVEFRIVTSQGHIRPGASLGVPFDMYDRSEGGAIAQFEKKRLGQERASR
jgi:hypothetical protein